jgi:phosphoglycerate dehydrogenase-like enzyme
MRIWLPQDKAHYQLDDVTQDVQVDVFDGRGAVPASLGEVEFYVLPLLAGPAPATLMSRMPSLRVAQAQSAGVEDVLPLVPAGVTFCNARDVHDTSTAEMAVTLILSALRGIPEFVRHPETVTAGRLWDSLADKTVLIVGSGSIGTAVEERLSGFECEVRRVARRPRDGVHSVDELPKLLPSADVVVLTVPMTSATQGMVDAAFLAAMHDGALLVNVARGPVVRTDDLLRETKSGRLRAALDVTDPEPLPLDHPLRACANVLITPHAAGRSTALEPRLARFIGQQVRRYIRKEPLLNVISGEY